MVELLVVMAILGILAAAFMPLGEMMLKAQKERELRQALWEIRDAIDEYKRVMTAPGVTVDASSNGYPATLLELTQGSIDPRPQTQGRTLYFLRRVPRDPMADPALLPEKTWRLRSYASSPAQPSPGLDVFDVHSSSDELALDGTSYGSW